MALPLVNCPEATYATKNNIAFPGSSAQATAAEGTAETVVGEFVDSFVDNVSVTVDAGSIEVAD